MKQYLDVADILILVPDRYDVQNSLKTFERKRRCLSNTPEPIIQNSPTPLPRNFQQFLSNLRNKSNFVKFLLSELEKWFSRDISNTKEVYLGLHDGKTQHITYRENKEIGSLRSDHEEADSRIFVYGHYIGKNYSHTRHITGMIIKSPDTDFAIIACYQPSNALDMFSDIWFETGFSSNLR